MTSKNLLATNTDIDAEMSMLDTKPKNGMIDGEYIIISRVGASKGPLKQVYLARRMEN